jgi:heat shock protein HtpX
MGMLGNTLKTFLLIAGLTALLLWIGNYLGGISGLAIAAFFVIVFNGVMYWFSDKIVLKMYRAQELDAGHRVTKMVHEIAHRAKMPLPKVFLTPSATPNAFATGRSPKHSAVAVTQGILNLLDDEELKGVIAHELSHIRNRDTLIQTIAAMIAGVISFVASMARWGAIFGGFGGRDNDSNDMIGLLVLAILTPIIALILQMALSRTREYAADESAAMILKNQYGLIHALQKLEHGNKKNPMRNASPSTAPMFIINPLRGKGFFELLSTHPTTEKRVGKLKAIRF